MLRFRCSTRVSRTSFGATEKQRSVLPHMASPYMEKPAVVIDNGTGYTKMGYAGNCEPSFIIPSVIATKDPKAVRGRDHLRGTSAAGWEGAPRAVSGRCGLG